MIKTYYFNYDMGEAEASFEVDTDEFNNEMALATLEFFGWDWDRDNNPIDEVLIKYAMKAIELATINYHNTRGVISDFEEIEGFARVDGSSGIKLIKVTDYEFDEYKLERLEKKIKQY